MGKEKMSAGRHGEEFWAQESKSNIGFKLMTAQGWSQGQGLGKKGEGRTNFIRAKKKDDNLGLGAKQGEDDSWGAMTGLYNEILQRLAVEGGDHLHEDGGVSKVAEVEDTSKTLQDYIVKKRLYGRFRKAKDTCGYSESDMAAIMGKKTETTTTTPVAKQVSTRVVAAAVEKKDDNSGVHTVTSKMSIRDYFSKKMSMGGSRYSAAGGAGFTEEFQEQHFNQLTRVADGYSGKMGLGSGRSSDPWETSSMNYSSSSFSQPSIETKSQVEEDKPAKKKKKKDKEQQEEPVVEEAPAKKSKKAKLDSSSSSSSSTASSASSSSSSASTSEPTKKSKKAKKQEEVVTPEVPAEPEKSKKNKKSKVTIELVEKKHEEQKEKREEKKNKKDKKDKEAPRSCAFCSSLDVPMACGRCQKAFYCGAECQTNHWTTHKIKCSKLQC